MCGTNPRSDSLRRTSRRGSRPHIAKAIAMHSFNPPQLSGLGRREPRPKELGSPPKKLGNTSAHRLCPESESDAEIGSS